MHLYKARKLRILRLAAVVAALHVSSVAWASATPNHVRDVRVHAATDLAGATEIEVSGTEAPSFQVRSEAGGKRLILELANADVAGAPESISDPRGLVSGILTQSFHTESGNMTRLTIHLSKDATFRVRADGTTLHVLFTPSSQGVVPNTDPAPKAAKTVPSAELTEVRFERQPIIGSQYTAEPYIAGPRIVTVTAQVFYDADTLQAGFVAGTQSDFAVTFTSGSVSMAFTLHNAVITECTAPVNKHGRIMQTVTFRGVSDGTDNGVAVVVINTQSSRVAA